MTNKISESYVNQSSDFNSNYVDIQDHNKYSVQITVTNGDTFTGTVTLQACNDYASWVDVPDTTSTLSGTSDVQIYDSVQTSVGYVRVVVAITTGSADFKIDWVLK